MGLLDSVLGAVMGGGQQGGNSPLMQLATQMLTNQGGVAGGGLSGLVEKFQQAGLGDQVASWISTGQNLPISADQISSALGNGHLGEIASKLGLDQNVVAGGLAKMLPELINHVTPNGQLPQDHNVLQDALSMFLKR